MGIWDNKLSPSKLDWIWQLEQDNMDLNLDLKDEKIRILTQYEFRRLVNY